MLHESSGMHDQTCLYEVTYQDMRSLQMYLAWNCLASEVSWRVFLPGGGDHDLLSKGNATHYDVNEANWRTQCPPPANALSQGAGRECPAPATWITQSQLPTRVLGDVFPAAYLIPVLSQLKLSAYLGLAKSWLLGTREADEEGN